MNEYEIGLFVLIWAITDRIREIAIFPGWISVFGKWFDTFYNDKITTLWPFRTAYHTFKNLAVIALVIIVWINYGFIISMSIVAIWGSGQFIGLLFRKNLN